MDDSSVDGANKPFLIRPQETAATQGGEPSGDDRGGGGGEGAPLLRLRGLEDGGGEAVPAAAHPLLQQQVRRHRRLPVRPEVHVQDAQGVGDQRIPRQGGGGGGARLLRL